MRQLTRRLLRDWKHYNRVRGSRYLLRPQDSNLHVWHLVLRSGDEEEIYALLYLNEQTGDGSSVIILKCMTPNAVFPLHGNVSLTHLQRLLEEEHGFLRLIEHISTLVFSERDPVRSGGRLGYAWNRIMCKDFLRVFPEIHGCLQEGDFQLVKNYSARNCTGDKIMLTQNIDYMGMKGMKNYFQTDNMPEIRSLSSNHSLIACDSNVNVYKHANIDEAPEQHRKTKRQKL